MSATVLFILPSPDPTQGGGGRKGAQGEGSSFFSWTLSLILVYLCLVLFPESQTKPFNERFFYLIKGCLLYTSDAADE